MPEFLIAVTADEDKGYVLASAPKDGAEGLTVDLEEHSAKLTRGFWYIDATDGVTNIIREAHIGDFLRLGFPVPGMAEVTRTVERVVKKYGPTVKEWLESTRRSGPDTFGRVAESPTTIAVNRGEPNTDEVAELSRQFPDVKFTKAEATGDGT
jgi:hypothetical protein